MSKAKIIWCWPEAIGQDSRVQRLLESIGTLHIVDTLPASAGPAQILVPRVTCTVNASVFDRFPELRLLATPSTGTDHLDLPEARRRGIRVISLKDDIGFLESLQSTAELAWLLILNCVRRFREANRRAMGGDFDPAAVRGNELIGKTIGIIGLGRLGTMVSRFALAFRMRVLATDIKAVSMEGVEGVDRDTLLRESDIVSIHVHLNDSTRGMIGSREIALMKKGAVLVNTSRGAVLDEMALLDALSSGQLSAAGLDVITGERDGKLEDHPLIRYARDHDHLILTPHIGGCTVEAQAKAFLHLAEKIVEAWRTIS